MEDKLQTAKLVVKTLLAEMKAYEISFEMVSCQTINLGLNRGRGYKLQAIKNMMCGRKPLQADVLEAMVTMVEDALEEKERIAAGDLSSMDYRLQVCKNRRSEIEQMTAA
ncbi:hypothetical protein [Neolewinella antarctica]|uniref:Uncharacterized protein n=1 Tax=Neolewinella antarctica TaxID=442734 RepID=A0ABX0X7M7_9BACT|nr:hypothetical protein [Neolewinella antarctica]NJC24827.1 hypothetical protein [Neolewinella antarctica]